MAKKALITLFVLISIGIATGIFTYFLHKDIVSFSQPYIYKTIDSIQPAEAALVLGAKVFANGKLFYMTQDRADMGIALYKAGKVKKILVSGDHGHKNYDEVNTIRNYILKQGVPPQDVFMDHAGFDTYNSMYRARDIFKVKDMIVVTQKFHLTRALYLARNMEISAVGICADKHNYRNYDMNASNMRELPAALKAFLEVKVFHPKPHFLGDSIPITGDGRITEDKK